MRAYVRPRYTYSNFKFPLFIASMHMDSWPTKLEHRFEGNGAADWGVVQSARGRFHGRSLSFTSKKPGAFFEITLGGGAR